MNRRGFFSFLAAAPVVAPIAAQTAIQGGLVSAQLARVLGAERLSIPAGDWTNIRFAPSVVSDLDAADRVQREIESFLKTSDSLSLSLGDIEPRRAWAPPQVREIA